MQQERKEATQREGCVQVEGSRQEVVTVDEVKVKTVEASQCPPARHFYSRRLFRRSRGNTDTGEL